MSAPSSPSLPSRPPPASPPPPDTPCTPPAAAAPRPAAAAPAAATSTSTSSAAAAKPTLTAATNTSADVRDFRFRPLRRRVDWRRLDLLDVAQVAEEGEVRVLEELFPDVSRGDATAKGYGHPQFLGVVQLAQLSTQYLAYSQVRDCVLLLYSLHELRRCLLLDTCD